MMRLVRRHSLILVGVCSVVVSLGVAIALIRTSDSPLGVYLLFGLPMADLAALFGLWALLRRRDESPSSDALAAALRRGRPVVVDLYSNT